MTHLVLIGAGHAHLFVLQRLIKRFRHAQQDCKVTLISPDQWQYYSGMIPGWVEGHYPKGQCRIDVRSLIKHSPIVFIQQRVIHIDAQAKTIQLSNGSRLSYDFLSLDIGSGVQPLPAPLVDSLSITTDLNRDRVCKHFAIKPLNDFCQTWESLIKRITATTNTPFTLAIVGGGAAGVELAFAANAALKKINPSNSTVLVCGTQRLLSGFTCAARAKAQHALVKQGITLILGRAAQTQYGLILSDGKAINADAVLCATGAKSADWLAHSHLALDEHGYIQVDAYHRSISHASVFAAGDTCSRTDFPLKRSGVHAVRAGPILADNLVAILDNQHKLLKPFLPRRYSLFLLASGSKSAIGSWGPFTVAGRWVWRWKDSIDRRFIHSFSYDDE